MKCAEEGKQKERLDREHLGDMYVGEEAGGKKDIRKHGRFIRRKYWGQIHHQNLV